MKLRAAADRVDHPLDLIFQFEQFAGWLVDFDRGDFVSIKRTKRKRWMPRSVFCSAPGCPQRAFGPGDLCRLMVFKGR